MGRGPKSGLRKIDRFGGFAQQVCTEVLFRAQRRKSFGPKAQQVAQRRAQPWMRKPPAAFSIPRAGAGRLRRPAPARGMEISFERSASPGLRPSLGDRMPLRGSLRQPQSRNKNGISRCHRIRRLSRRPAQEYPIFAVLNGEKKGFGSGIPLHNRAIPQ